MSSEKISAELQELVRESSPDHLLRVIVSTAKGADLEALIELGLVIHRRFPRISAVAGLLPAAAVEKVAALELVVHVEYDGPITLP